MKRLSALVMSALIFLTFFDIPIFAQEESVSIIVEYNTADDKIHENTRQKSLHSVKSVDVIKKDLEVIEFNNTFAAYEAINNLKKNGNVRHAEINRKRHLMGVVPNDLEYSRQWGNKYIDASTAWEAVSYQKRQVVVAVIDSGVTANHPDLSGKVLTGYNALNGSEDVTDEFGHGTFVSGIIAASINNQAGIAGVAGTFNVAILPIKVVNEEGYIQSSDMISAIDYAISKGVDVINMSFGGPSASYFEFEAITKAKNAGIAIVAASGNDGDGTINYPASYDNVISVTAHNQDGSVPYFSNYNKYVDVIAPGGGIYSTTPTGYAYGSGTSFSCPHVAGIAAMIKAVAPNVTTQQVTAIITSSAVKPAGQTERSDVYGYGYANASAALKNILDLDYSSSSITLNYDRIHLASGLTSINIKAMVNPAYNNSLIWYKNSDTSVSTGDTSYTVIRGEQVGNTTITAKIPLNSSNEAKCEYSWAGTTTITSADTAITGINVTNGKLLGDFDTNKTSYYINAENESIMPVILPALNSDVSYLIKNAKTVGDSTALTVIDSSGNQRTYTFKVIMITEGIFPYTVNNGNTVTFAAASYKSSGNDYNLYMICAIYSSVNQLLKTVAVPISVTNGYNTYKTSSEMPNNCHASVILLKDLTNIAPYDSALTYR